MSLLLVLDFGHFHFRNYAAHQRLSYEGHPTGGLYGTIKQLVAIMEHIRPTDIIVCEDAPPYKRREECPLYKADRGDWNAGEAADLQESKEITLEALDSFGTARWRIPGLEADDLVAACAQYFGGASNDRFSQVVIASGDSDLFQCLSPKVALLRKKSHDDLYGLIDFCEEYKPLTPEYWPYVLCLAGTHNGLPGIKGVGIKTATKAMSKVIDQGDSGFDDKLWKPAYDQAIRDTLRLVRLPHESCPQPETVFLDRGPLPFNATRVEAVCMKYGMRWTNAMEHEWAAWRLRYTFDESERADYA